MQIFDYRSAETLQEAVTLRAGGEAAMLLAGGTDLIAQMKERRRQPKRIVDVKRVPGMTQITEAGDGSLWIGAAATATTVRQHAAVQRNYPALAEAAGMIGSRQIQNRATIGGNVCNAAPSADAVPSLICHDATAIIASPSGERMIPLEQLFEGPGRTVLGADELLAAIVLAPVAERSASAYLRFTPRREMDIAVAGVGVRLTLDADGSIEEARVALASVAPTPIRAPSAEQCLTGAAVSADIFAAAAEAARSDAKPISDTRGSADFRRHLVGVLCKRALAACAGRLGLEVSR